MAWARDWDESTPVGSVTNASDIDLWLRYLQIDAAERLESMFYGFSDSSSAAPEDAYGVKHLKLYSQTSPTSVTNFGFLFGKDVLSKIELHYLDEDGDEIQLTSGGRLYSNGNFAVAGNTALAGTLAVGGNATITGIATLGDSSQLASNAAPTSDADIANKKYVDDLAVSVVKAWVQFDGDDPATIQGTGHNVASVVRNSIGNYTITFTDALDNNDYAVSGFCADGTTGAGFVCNQSSASPESTTNVIVETWDSEAAALADFNRVHIMIIGDQS